MVEKFQRWWEQRGACFPAIGKEIEKNSVWRVQSYFSPKSKLLGTNKQNYLAWSVLAMALVITDLQLSIRRVKHLQINWALWFQKAHPMLKMFDKMSFKWMREGKINEHLLCKFAFYLYLTASMGKNLRTNLGASLNLKMAG